MGSGRSFGHLLALYVIWNCSCGRGEGRKKETQRKLSLEEEDVFHVMMEHFEGGTVRVEPACKWGNY
jgi:hypothetical protein